MHKLLIAIICLPSALAIFSETFETGIAHWERTSIPGAHNWTASQTNPNSGGWHAQSQPGSTLIGASILQKNISTQRYKNITINYWKQLVGLDASDEFRAKWYNGTSWITLEQTGNNAANTNYTLMRFNVTGNAHAKLRFECSAQATTEYCRIDDVAVTGTPINYTGLFPYHNRTYAISTNATHISFIWYNEHHTAPLDNKNHFTHRINYVWFAGTITNNTLALKQYAPLGTTHTVQATAQPNTFTANVTIPHLPFLNLSNATAQVTITPTTSIVTPVNIVAHTSTSPISSWNASGHVYHPMLFQTKLVNSTITISEWVTFQPSWEINLTTK